jgi:hypothetical protein
LNNPSDIVTDVVNDEILVASSESIVVYPKKANGDLVPLRTIQQGANSIEIDTVHNEIFASNGGKINVFERTANGSVAPLRTFEDSKYSPYDVKIVGIAADAINDEIFVASLLLNPFATSPPASIITVYPRTANGEVMPLRTFPPSYGVITDLALDPVHNEIFVSSNGGPCIIVYKKTANASDTPIRTICEDASQMSEIWSITMDAENNEIFVSGFDKLVQPAINVYSRTADGNVAPLRTLLLRKYVADSLYPERIALSPQ